MTENFLLTSRFRRLKRVGKLNSGAYVVRKSDIVVKIYADAVTNNNRSLFEIRFASASINRKITFSVQV